ncbi:unnamed protein product, partial [Bubo scandiacus]
VFNFSHFGIYHLDILPCILIGGQGPLLKKRQLIQISLDSSKDGTTCMCLFIQCPFCSEGPKTEHSHRGAASPKDLQMLPPFCFTTHFPFAGYFLRIHIKIQSTHREKSWSFNFGPKLVLDPSQLTLE